MADCACCFGALELVLEATPPYWRHHQGGGVIMQRCWGCGYFAAQARPSRRCPNCGSQRRWVFDHVAQADPITVSPETRLILVS